MERVFFFSRSIAITLKVFKNHFSFLCIIKKGSLTLFFFIFFPTIENGFSHTAAPPPHTQLVHRATIAIGKPSLICLFLLVSRCLILVVRVKHIIAREGTHFPHTRVLAPIQQGTQRSRQAQTFPVEGYQLAVAVVVVCRSAKVRSVRVQPLPTTTTRAAASSNKVNDKTFHL